MKEETPPMWTDKLPLAEIARIFDRDPAQVRRAYDEWLERKRGRRGPVKPDNRLLSLLSGLSSASISNYVQGKAGSLSEENHRRLGQLVKLVGYVPSRAAQNLRSRRRNTVSSNFCSLLSRLGVTLFALARTFSSTANSASVCSGVP